MSRSPTDLSRTRATLIGFAAILLWSLLAVLTVASGRMPALQLAAVTFAIGAAVGAATWLWRRAGPQALRQPVRVWLLGVGGLFGYHALYFLALRFAPPAEAGLLNYFWPLLIVLFAALLPGERLRSHHLIGVGLGLIGTIVLFAGRIDFSAQHGPGYATASLAALVWATYSVLSRRFAAVPTDAVVGFCAGTAVLAALSHLAFEATVWPANATQWLAVLALGLGPVGAAFYAWDFGVKHGDIRVLGAASYAAPILSTSFLVLAGYADLTWSLALAAVLIAGGGLIAAKDLLFAIKTD